MMKATVDNPVRLYRYLLRCLKSLPEAPRDHYKHYIRQQYNSHSDETDPERIKQIISRSINDIEWLMKKYGVKHK